VLHECSLFKDEEKLRDELAESLLFHSVVIIIFNGHVKSVNTNLTACYEVFFVHFGLIKCGD